MLEQIVFRRYSHPLELGGYQVCPICKTELSFCEVEGCNNLWLYEGWVSTGIMLQRRRLCKDHVVLTEAYKNNPKVLEELEKENDGTE